MDRAVPLATLMGCYLSGSARTGWSRCLLVRIRSYRQFLAVFGIVLVLDHPFLEIRRRNLTHHAFVLAIDDALFYVHLEIASAAHSSLQ